MKSNSCNCYEWLMPILFHSQAKYQYYPSPSTSRRVPHVTPTFVTPYPTKNKHPCQLLIPHDASPDCFSPMRIHHLKKKKTAKIHQDKCTSRPPSWMMNVLPQALLVLMPSAPLVLMPSALQVTRVPEWLDALQKPLLQSQVLMEVSLNLARIAKDHNNHKNLEIHYYCFLQDFFW